MKPIVNFNERLDGMEITVNCSYFTLSSNSDLNKDKVCIYPKDLDGWGWEPHLLFQIRWNDMGFEFFRMQKHMGRPGFEKTKILSGYFTKDDCKDPIRFVNNVICRNIDHLMSNDKF